MYSWGRGAEGQLGLGGLQDTPTPIKVKALQGKKALQVGQGCGGVACAMQCGWGQGWGAWCGVGGAAVVGA